MDVRTQRRPRLLHALGATTAVTIAAALLTAGPGVAAGGVTLTKANDANHDGVFSASETIPATATYPYSVTYQLTLSGGSVPGPSGPFHTIQSISDSTTTNLGTCAALGRTKIYNNQTERCTYSVTLAEPQLTPLVNAGWRG